jgi:guanylate kinase
MPFTPQIIARAQKKWQRKLQEGKILSHTTIRAENTQTTIALIELKNGSRVLGHLTSHLSPLTASLIGQSVHPRMSLSHITPEGLRIYDVAYEIIVPKKLQTFEESVFPRYILAFTGPSGVGKSTVSSMLATICSPYLERVPILTTRKPKHGDDGEYTYTSVAAFDALKRQDAFAAIADIPSKTESRCYGYRKEDLEKTWKKGKIPVVVTEMHLLQGLAATFGRRSILSCGLLPPGRSRRAMLSSLLFRLRTRGRETEAQIRERLKHALHDLAFFKRRADLFDHLIVNEKLEHVIEKLKPHIPGLKEA